MDEVLASDEDNSREGRRVLGQTWHLADQAFGLFLELANKVLNPTVVTSGDAHLGAGKALLLAHKAAAMAMLDVVRFHFVEGAGETRRMLEWMAIGYHLFTVPGDYDIWLRALKGGLANFKDPRFRAYKAAFNPATVQEWLAILNPELPALYQRCNLMAHGTVVSQARSILYQTDPRNPVMAIKYIDLEANDAVTFVGEMLLIVDGALYGLRSLGRELLNGSESKEEWNAAIGAVIQQRDQETARWRQVLKRPGG